MKVLHIIAGDLDGGAARGAYWLSSSLRNQGVVSQIFTNSKITYNDESVLSCTQSKLTKVISLLRNQLENIYLLAYRNRKKYIFSTGMFGTNFLKTKAYQEADIIHLHWINGGFINIKDLSKIDKPIVWTVRDMWPMTGGCHYAISCQNYKSGCGNCKQLGSMSKFDLSRFIMRRKEKYLPKSMKIVGISNWVSLEAKKSSLFRDFDVRTIFNNVNTKDFLPVNKDLAKNILNIKTDKKIILVAARSLKDFYKGFDKYIEAIKMLDNKKYFLCFIGNIDKKIIEGLDFDFKSFGYLHDNISLRLVYSLADVFVAPSIMEAFGKTLAESMACGTPVVCFDATGPKDIVDHKINGYLAKPFDAVGLAKGIGWIVDHESYDELTQEARNKIIECFDSSIVAKQYIELYDEVLNSSTSV